jgi:hypothetical protein
MSCAWFSASGHGFRLECLFDLYIAPEDGSWSVGSKFHFVKNGEVKSILLTDVNNIVSKLVYSLHELMREHTGGNWNEFLLTLGKDGKARTEFNYPDQSNVQG